MLFLFEFVVVVIDYKSIIINCLVESFLIFNINGSLVFVVLMKKRYCGGDNVGYEGSWIVLGSIIGQSLGMKKLNGEKMFICFGGGLYYLI